jgi:hypothetical protein
MKEDTTTIDPTWMSKTGGFAKDMTLRQWYAGLAMQGLVFKGAYDFADTAECANLIADAMLKARDAK